MKKVKKGCCSSSQIKDEVKKHYKDLITGKRSSCCGPSSQGKVTKGLMIQTAGYSEEDRSQVPEEAYLNSFGCGNPMAYAEVKPGEVVLDLGSGAGLDVLLASKRVGPNGRVIGLDMIPEMIEKAKENVAKAGVKNVEFRLGEMEDMPIEDGSVNWIISNCVINLSPDKRKVFQEAFRVLKPNGKILVSDIVAEGIPEELKGFMWSSCIGGAVDKASYLRLIREAGFEEVRIVGRLDYDPETIKGFLNSDRADLSEKIKKEIDEHGNEWDVKISSVKVSAKKKASI
jgi:ubiquinone/menaquinone biosynthesis C-methylase UbiE